MRPVPLQRPRSARPPDCFFLGSPGEVENKEKLAALMLLLRLVRVIRLAAVMMRTMNTTNSISSSVSDEVKSLSGLKEAIDANLPGYRGTNCAKKWEELRLEQCFRFHLFPFRLFFHLFPFRLCSRLFPFRLCFHLRLGFLSFHFI